MEDKKQDDEKEKKVSEVSFKEFTEEKKPKIRFAGFTDDWEQRKLGDVFEQTSNFVNLNDSNVELWSLTVEDGLTPKSERYNREFLVKKEDNFKEVRPGDIVYNPMNMTLGAVGYNGMSKSVAVSGYYTTMIAKEGYDAYYINTWLKSPQALLLYKTYATGTLIEKQRVQFPTLSVIPVAFPNYEEQKKIGEYFRTLDNLITLYQRKSDELKEVKKYMLQKMFPKNGETKPEIRFAGFTDDWQQRKLGEVTIPIKLKAKNNDYPVYSVTNQQGFIPQAEQFIDREVASKNKANYSVVSKNQFAYNPSRINVGSIAYFKSNIKVIISPLYVVFECTDRLDKDFLNCFISTDSFKNQRETNMEGSVRDSLSYDGFSEISICLPSIQEQSSIGSFFDNLDNLITLNQRKCDELKELKKYMLQNMFPRMS